MWVHLARHTPSLARPDQAAWGRRRQQAGPTFISCAGCRTRPRLNPPHDGGPGAPAVHLSWTVEAGCPGPYHSGRSDGAESSREAPAACHCEIDCVEPLFSLEAPQEAGTPTYFYRCNAFLTLISVQRTIYIAYGRRVGRRGMHGLLPNMHACKGQTVRLLKLMRLQADAVFDRRAIFRRWTVRWLAVRKVREAYHSAPDFRY